MMVVELRLIKKLHLLLMVLTFKDCIVSSNIQKAIEGASIDKCFERIYLAKIGHAPFAHSEDANKRTYDD